MTTHQFNRHRQLGPLPVSFTPGLMHHNIHIRLNTPIYYGNGQPVGFKDNEHGVQYKAAMSAIVAKVGFDVPFKSYNHSSTDAYASIYIHPQDVSGVMTEEQALALADAIDESGGPSTVRWIDIYEPLEVLSIEEIKHRFNHYKEVIVDLVLDGHKTTRKTKFVSKSMNHELSRLSGLQLHNKAPHGEGGATTVQMANEVLGEIVDGLIKEGRLIPHPLQKGYMRTANAGEMAALRRKQKLAEV